MPRRQSTDSLPLGYVHCQGCGEAHRRDEMLSLCLFCVQSKFIPRQDWLTVGFQDRKSYVQWWNHEKKFKIKNVKREIEQLKEKERLRQAWYDSGKYLDKEEEDLEDDKIMDEFVRGSKIEENGIITL